MHPTVLVALAATAFAGTLLLSAGAADAQARRSQADDMFYYNAQQRENRYRVRPRVTVRQRSYLDPGPEVSPGEYKYREYAEPYGYSAIDTILPVGQGWNRRPFNDPWDVPGTRSRSSFPF
jgi:hypothetical protein